MTATCFGYDDGDVDTNRTGGETLGDLIDRRYSRRDALRGGASAAAMAVFGGAVLAACGEDSPAIDPRPTISVGQAGTTSTGNRVTLTATATDNGTVAATAFTQVGGPAVTLSSATGLTTSFIAPAVTAATDVVIRFAATDDKGGTTSADTIVTIQPAALTFTAVAKNRNDVVTVPAGYTVSVLYRLGDPILAGAAAYRNDGTDGNFAARAGDQHDALHYFPLAATGTGADASNSSRGLLVMNHENIVQVYLHPNGPTSTGGVRPEGEALKEIEAHGVSVVEVTQAAASGAWAYVQGGALNRRITPNTPMTFSGPARGNALLQTAFSPTGVAGRGTINNCANGFTPWATSLTCEENWAGYFRRPTAADDARRTPKERTALTRYGVRSSGGNYGWSTVQPADASNTLFRRWDAQATGASATADYRNEPNQFGWVVEMDPYDVNSVPRKRTALGRMNHEGCWPGAFVAGRRPAWYTGDDAVNEYLYKFVSNTAWSAADANAADRLAIGDKYLDAGTLYVAKFNADGSGQWLPLVFGQNGLDAANTRYPFADQADVLTHCRLAGDSVGATKMDRPEWTAVNPVNGEMYLTLTNNSTRTAANTDAANPRSYQDPPSNSFGNRNGHILRLREGATAAENTTEATTFRWDIYAFGAGSDLSAQNINLSGLDATNDFSSPDGLWFGRASNASGQGNPLLWIQTDDGAFTDQTNNQMLAALPGTVGDGGTRTVTNAASGGGSATQATIVGKAPGSSLKRFLVGPVECEITGVDSTPDGRTLFVNIQHPGEDGTIAGLTSNWPASQTGAAPGNRPRSATVVVQRADGGIVGL